MKAMGFSRIQIKWLWRRFNGSSRAYQVLLHSALVVLLAGVGGLLSAGGRWGVGNDVAATFMIMLLGLGCFWVLSTRIPSLADRLVYRRRQHPQVILAQMAEKLAGALYMEEIARLLAQELPQRLGATRGVLLVVNEERTVLQSVGQGDAAPLPAAEWDQFWLTLPNAPLALAAVPPSTSPAVLAWMRAQTLALLAPLQAGKRLIGLLGLGPRPGACGYFSDEVRMLGTLTRHATIAVQNALLVQHMATYQQQLQEEVAQHTRIMMADRSRLNAILQNLADALLVTDTAGRIQLVNPVAENLLRRAARTLLGQDIHDVAPVPEWLAVIARAQEHPGVIETTRITMTDPRLLLETGALGERILTVSATALGDRSAVICILHDITHEVEVDRLKSEFITTISHELRTPLTSILGFARLVQRIFTRTILPALGPGEAAHLAVARVTKNLEIMVQEGGRLTSLLNDVLDISALDSGGIEWHDQVFSPADVLTQTVAQYRPRAAQKDLQLNLVLEGTLPPLHADPKRVAQVLNNLLSNAIKFTVQGSITVTAQVLEGETIFRDWIAPPEGGLLVSVTDTGIGISRATMRRIFQRFSQGGNLLIDKPEGVGLGLTLSREIILHYGGDIWVESTIGQGATFCFVLPRPPSPTLDFGLLT